MSGWGGSGADPEGQAGVNAPCVWIQYWVQLDTPAKAADYRRYLVNYSDQQRASGRYERPTNVRLRSVMEWLDYNKVVPGDVRLQVWLAFGFLLVCLLNTVGLLLAKRSEEHTSELQSLMRFSYAVFCLKKKTYNNNNK